MKLSLVYMVAGLSSRFGRKIKQLTKVGKNNETFIECSIQQALKGTNNKISKIIFIVGEKTFDPFKELFKDKYKGIPIYYVKQTYDIEKRDRPWGTADAISVIKDIINEPCSICNGDDLYGESSFKTLLNHFEKNKNTKENAVISMPLIKTLPEQGEVTRGIFKVKNNYLQEAIEVFNISQTNFKEKNLTENSLCNINLFGLHPEVIDKIDERVKAFKEINKNDRKIECFIHVELAELCKNNEIKLRVYESKEKWLGITNPEDENIVREELRRIN